MKAAFSRLVISCLALGWLTSCGVVATDPEFSQKLATARVDCSGQEIVGVWVSKTSLSVTSGAILTAEGGAFSDRKTLLIRPNGTGVLRDLDTDGTSMSVDLVWKYVGAGVWQGKTDPPRMSDFRIRYTGRDLLYHFDRKGNHVDLIFVSADNPAAVDEHLSKRRESL